ncbi:MAG: SulP family sulfate permease [Candidatus Azotimanducaceae bacterium]|jgi:SulP family sulfate permease
MPHRAHLFSLRIAHALRESCFGDEKYNLLSFRKDVLAGLAVGIIAIPLAMSLAIACGVSPQYGLYSAIIGGFIIALTGGSRFSISGPTAAFVVILFPIAQQHGLAGLLLATFLSGLILIAMAYARLGRFIEYIPQSVTLGFTGGIAIVIATLQLKDFLGLPIEDLPELYVEKVWLLITSVGDTNATSLFISSLTIGIMLLWPKLKTVIPPHLPAVVCASLVGVVAVNIGFELDTIGSRFSYLMPDGSTGAGIPPYLPHFDWPWNRLGAGGQPFELSVSVMISLLPAAFAIAMLGAIESLLCAVVLDGMSGKRHSANSELLGQGIGNITVPFFGGITATAAIARSAANYRAGAKSPVSGMIHAITVLLALILLAPLLAYLPIPAMAALLIVVAWNMSDAGRIVHLFKYSPVRDIAVLVTCLSLTVFFDMVIAITVGVLLAFVLFVSEIAGMTKVTDMTKNKKLVSVQIPDHWEVLKINGPLFFAAADRVFGEIIERMSALDGVVLYLDGVTLLDSGGVAALTKFTAHCEKAGKKIVVADLQFQPLKTLARANFKPIAGVISFHSTLEGALQSFSEENPAC